MKQVESGAVLAIEVFAQRLRLVFIVGVRILQGGGVKNDLGTQGVGLGINHSGHYPVGFGASALA